MAHRKKIRFEEIIAEEHHQRYDENGSIFGNLNKTMKTEEFLFTSLDQPKFKPHKTVKVQEYSSKE